MLRFAHPVLVAQKELGLALTPVKETIQDMASTLVALGLAVPKLRQQQA